LESEALEKFLSQAVVLDGHLVNRPVHLDDEFRLRTEKVDNERPDRVLSPNLKPAFRESRSALQSFRSARVGVCRFSRASGLSFSHSSGGVSQGFSLPSELFATPPP
jgi:hypothetical protein